MSDRNGYPARTCTPRDNLAAWRGEPGRPVYRIPDGSWPAAKEPEPSRIRQLFGL